jgi:DNA-binding CsgD family transcriptional regulator
MLEQAIAAPEIARFHGAARPATFDATALYAGPERRRHRPAMTHWLLAAVDELDYGIVLLDDDARSLHANHAAKADLRGTHPLQLADGELRARAPRDAVALRGALDAARRGLRAMLTVGPETDRVNIAVVPLRGLAAPEVGGSTMVTISRRAVCAQLSVQGFARSHSLTAAETRVLSALCEGREPNLAAQTLGVAISTVRTQIHSIRMKTGARSIGELVRQVAVLPPLLGVLRETQDA